jgi:hypothetical protein
MRKTLLIAAATLASGIISSQAGVYSQNVVGYANLPAVSGKNTLLEVPFTIGVSNGVNEVFGETLPLYSEVLTYSQSGYSIALFDNGNGPGTPEWYQSDDSTPLTTLPTLPPGEGFFLIAQGNVTNVFAGAVAVNVGSSNNMVLLSGKNNLVGSVVPYAGAVTNGNTSTGGPDLNGLPIYSELLFYTAATGYTIALFDNGNGPGTPNWYYSDDSTPYVDPTTGGNVPNIAVGQGFFIIPQGPYTWTTGL